MFIDLKRNKDCIKHHALKIHSIFSHNAACKHVFSILEWYFGKRQTRLSVEHLEIMAQMHSYLVENAKLKLNYIDLNICQKNFLSVFNKIAIFIKDNTDLFSKKDSFSFLEELIIKEDTEEFSEESDNLVKENSTSLEVKNLMTLSSKLELDKSS
ncbi:1088_t:CDS:2, partial [Cetraspora pellucida]